MKQKKQMLLNGTEGSEIVIEKIQGKHDKKPSYSSSMEDERYHVLYVGKNRRTGIKKNIGTNEILA